MTLDTTLACLHSNILYLGSEREKGEYDCLCVVDICITLQNAKKTTKENAAVTTGAEANTIAPILFSVITGVAVHADTILKMRLLRRKIVDTLWIPLPSCFSPSTEHFGESLCTKSHTHIKLCAHILI